MIRLCAFADEANETLEGQIAALQRNNIGLLEIRNVAGKNVKDLTLEEAENYAKVLEQNGIRVWSIGSPVGKVKIDVDFEQYLEEVRHICRLANIFGATKIRMFSFFEAYEQGEKVIEYLTKLVEVANEFGVTMCHENEKDVYGDTVARVEELMDSVPGLKFVYDPANYLQCGQSVSEAMDKFHARTEYFHVKDVIVETDELVPAGHGDGQIKTLVERITDDKVITVEPHLAVFSGYSAIDNTVMKHKFHFSSNENSFDFAVGELKKIIISCGYHEVKGGFTK